MTAPPEKKSAPEPLAGTNAAKRVAKPAQVASLHDAQAIAESIVGKIAWAGAEAWCVCPGAAKHTTGTTPLDLHVVCEPIGTLKPGAYCFHSSCSAEVDALSFALRSALGKRSPSAAPRTRPTVIMPAKVAPPEFDPVKLERIARKLDGADAEWFAARSAKQPDNRTPASFLHELYRPGEKVVVFDVFVSQGQALWTHREPPFDACELDSFRTGRPHGVWFLNNPVSGDYADTGTFNRDGTPHLSRRTWRTVTSWRYLVLESDRANPAHWLAALAQMPIPRAAAYSSGGKSIHALVKIGAGSKPEWDAIAAEIKPMLITLGADRKAISGVRLTRLPCCQRVETGRMQELLFLNSSPDETPIADMPVIAPGWKDWLPADQDGGNA